MAADRPARPGARDRIAHDLDTTLFVEAGAGSGKTRSLVERVISLVATGTAELRSIAAITFTEKAGAELRDRLRRELQERATAEPDPTIAQRYLDARDQLDSAAIGTLHSFAQRILSENPIEAGLPPRVEVLDEVSSSVEFERRWGAFRDQLFEDPALERSLLLLDAAGVKPKALDVLAAAFGDNWDLVAERVPDTAPEPPRSPRCSPPARRAGRRLQRPGRLRRRRRQPRDPPRRDRRHVADAAPHAIDDELDLLAALGPRRRKPSFKVGIGRQANWPDINGRPPPGPSLGERAPRSIGSRDEVTQRVRAPNRRGHPPLHPRSRRRAQAAGRLEFHDLLVLARSVLRDPESGAVVRDRLHERYQRLLLDEFQDTDPIQIELAVRIAAADPRSDGGRPRALGRGAGRAGPPLRGRRPEAVDLPVPPGRHRDVPRRPRPLRGRRRRRRRAHHQLPHRRAGDRLGQPGVRRRS